MTDGPNTDMMVSVARRMTKRNHEATNVPRVEKLRDADLLVAMLFVSEMAVVEREFGNLGVCQYQSIIVYAIRPRCWDRV